MTVQLWPVIVVCGSHAGWARGGRGLLFILSLFSCVVDERVFPQDLRNAVGMVFFTYRTTIPS